MCLPIPKALITATFVWTNIKTHCRDKEKQVMSSKEQVKYSQSKTIIFYNNTQSPNYSYFCMKQDQDTLHRQRKAS